MLKLAPALDSQLQRDSDLTHFDYLCLAMLSESDDRTLRMSELAARANASLSRLSHVVSKLEKRGWVARCRLADSRRVTLVRLTEEGWDVLVAAAPGHVETVRVAGLRRALDREDVAALEPDRRPHRGAHRGVAAQVHLLSSPWSSSHPGVPSRLSASSSAGVPRAISTAPSQIVVPLGGFASQVVLRRRAQRQDKGSGPLVQVQLGQRPAAERTSRARPAPAGCGSRGTRRASPRRGTPPRRAAGRRRPCGGHRCSAGSPPGWRRPAASSPSPRLSGPGPRSPGPGASRERTG